MSRENLIRRSFYATTFEQRREMAKTFMNSEVQQINNDSAHVLDTDQLFEEIEQLLHENYEEVNNQ